MRQMDSSVAGRVTRHPYRVAVAALLVAAVWLSLTDLSLWLPVPARAALVAVVLLFLPGYLLQRALLGSRGWHGPALLPLSFGLSVGVAALAWAAVCLLGDSLDTFAYILATACTVLVAWNVLGEPFSSPGPSPPRGSVNSRSMWYLFPVLVPILFWMFVAVGQGALYDATSDAWNYLAMVRHTAHKQVLLPGDPYFQGVADPQRGGPWLALAALAIGPAGTEAATLWDLAPVFLIPVAILAHYLLADTLFENRLAAALSCFFLLYGFGRFSRDLPVAIVDSAGVAFSLFMVALVFAWRYVQSGQRRMLLLAILTGWAVAGIHMLIFSGLELTLGAFVLLHLIVRRDRATARRLLALILILALLAVPFAHTWLASGTKTDNPIYSDEWGLVTEFAGWRIVKPSAMIGGAPSPWAWAFLLSPALLILARRRDWALFLLSTMLLVVSLAFNPLFVEPVLRLHLLPAWGIWRLGLQIFQFQFVLGGLSALAIPWLLRKLGEEWGGPRVLHVALLMSCLALAFLPSAVPLVKPLGKNLALAVDLLEHKADTFPFNWDCTIEFLNEELPAGSVILADTETNYFIPALTDYYVLSMTYGRSSPLVDDDEQRRHDVATALDPDSQMSRVLEILDRYQVDYVVLVHNTPPTGPLSLSSEAYERLVDRFGGEEEHFRKVFSYEIDSAQRTTIFSYATQRSGSQGG